MCMEKNLCHWITSLLYESEGGSEGKNLLHLCHHSHFFKLPQKSFYKSKTANMGKEVGGEKVNPSQKTTLISQEKQYSLKLWTFSAVVFCVVQAPKKAAIEDYKGAPLEQLHQEQRKSQKTIWC